MHTQIIGSQLSGVLTCVSTINHSTLKLRGRERELISKASATGMSPLSPQGWVHGVFVFNSLSLSLPPEHSDDLPYSSPLSPNLATPQTTYIRKLSLLTQVDGKECNQLRFDDKAIDAPLPVRFNAPRCPDSSVGRAGD
ncbi:hypothetical protein D0N50_03955 [Erwinia billingiae]|nr:hypothetical protein D0N50_03955 [Erwinia billingiae]